MFLLLLNQPHIPITVSRAAFPVDVIRFPPYNDGLHPSIPIAFLLTPLALSTVAIIIILRQESKNMRAVE